MKNTAFLASIFAAVAAFGGVLDNAWIKGTTDKDPITYKPGEKMVFTLSFEDVEGTIPAGEYFLDWKRSGDDGLVETGKVAVTGAPFVYATQLGKPGFVRLQAEVVDKAGKTYVKTFTGDATTPEGKAAMNRFERQNKAIFFDGGAGACPRLWPQRQGGRGAPNGAGSGDRRPCGRRAGQNRRRRI